MNKQNKTYPLYPGMQNRRNSDHIFELANGMQVIVFDGHSPQRPTGSKPKSEARHEN